MLYVVTVKLFIIDVGINRINQSSDGAKKIIDVNTVGIAGIANVGDVILNIAQYRTKIVVVLLSCVSCC